MSEGQIWEIIAGKNSCFLTEQHFYYKTYTGSFITKRKFLSPEYLDITSFCFSFGPQFLPSCWFSTCSRRQVVLQCCRKQKKILSSDLSLQSKMLFFSCFGLCFVYFHMVRTGVIYFLYFLLSLLVLGLSHLLLRQAWEGRSYHCV